MDMKMHAAQRLINSIYRHFILVVISSFTAGQVELRIAENSTLCPQDASSSNRGIIVECLLNPGVSTIGSM